MMTMFQPPDGYRKYLLNRATATQVITDYIENCISSDDESYKHVYHKIMILHWADRDVNLFDMISEYFGGYLIPVLYQTQNVLSTFYTNNLSLILKIIKLDFIFPYNRNMYNIDILYNDKTSIECFGSNITLDEIVAGIVSKRFNEKCELDLSDFCNDPDFKQNNIFFYKLTLLSHFKILMLRMGRDTKLLNLSNNKLSQVPQDILNFFIKGNLIAIDFSNNLLPSLNELQRVSSRIEKLWLEGNPFCDELEVLPYIKQLILKFPRLKEVDGIQINQHGVMLPFYRNYLITTDRKTRLLVEKFITLYFSHYDSCPRARKLGQFYDKDVHWTLCADVADGDINSWANVYRLHARNLLNSHAKKEIEIKHRKALMGMLGSMPSSVHDLTSFCVDVLLHNKKHLIMVIDGLFKEIYTEYKYLHIKERYFSFRRTFVFTIHYSELGNATSTYLITKEMISVIPATPEQEKNFKEPLRNLDTLALVNPDPEDIATLCRAFMHITQLKNQDACEERLRACNWDLKLALTMFQQDLQNNAVYTKMLENDDFSDTSSLLEEVD